MGVKRKAIWLADTLFLAHTYKYTVAVTHKKGTNIHSHSHITLHTQCLFLHICYKRLGTQTFIYRLIHTHTHTPIRIQIWTAVVEQWTCLFVLVNHVWHHCTRRRSGEVEEKRRGEWNGKSVLKWWQFREIEKDTMGCQGTVKQIKIMIVLTRKWKRWRNYWISLGDSGKKRCARVHGQKREKGWEKVKKTHPRFKKCCKELFE